MALLGATPLGKAARNAVPAFARNADKVDGIHAARKPKAGYLLALGKTKKFPKSVVPAGPAGPQGPKGDKGDTGAQGAVGISGLELVTKQGPSSTMPTNGASVSCPAGKRALGGGGRTNVKSLNGPFLNGSTPIQNTTGWAVEAAEGPAFPATIQWFVTAYVICATVTP